jgi:hypothetical protein
MEAEPEPRDIYGRMDEQMEQSHPASEPTTQSPNPAALEYLRRINIDNAYTEPSDPTASERTNRKRLYTTTLTMLRREAGDQELRIIRQRPGEKWEAVWEKLYNAPVPERQKSEWYKAIHDIIPTEERLHKIHLTHTNTCRNCTVTDTITHRIQECKHVKETWRWTKRKVAEILNTTPDHIPDDLPTCPQYRNRSSKRRGAVSWMIAKLVNTRIQQRHLTIQ